MVNYWKRQSLIDIIGAAVVTVALWCLPKLGVPAIFVVANASDLAKIWIAPVLTMLGMTAATTAFISTVIERPEFSILRGSQAESQLWRVFAQNIGWLATSAIFAALVALTKHPAAFPIYVIGTFFVLMLIVCVGKFAWVMRQVIFVRIAQANVK